MDKPITKKEAIERLHMAPDVKFKAIEWIKLPENARMLVYEIRSRDWLLRGRDKIETRYSVINNVGGGSGGTLGSRSVKKGRSQ